MRFEQVKNWLEAYITANWMDEKTLEALNKIQERDKVLELKGMALEYMDGSPGVSERANKVFTMLDVKLTFTDLCDELMAELEG